MPSGRANSTAAPMVIPLSKSIKLNSTRGLRLEISTSNWVRDRPCSYHRGMSCPRFPDSVLLLAIFDPGYQL
jgi:hypothetical protein